MIGMVFGSIGTPLAPWHAAQVCALASISSAARAGVVMAGAAIAATIPTTPHRVKSRRLITADTSLTIFIVGSSILRWRSGAQGAGHACTGSPRPPILHQRRAERLEQCAIDRIAIGVVLGMPLH